MSTSNLHDKFLQVFEGVIEKRLQQVTGEEIYEKAISVKDAAYGSLMEFFRYIGDLIGEGVLEKSPFDEVNWRPLRLKYREMKWRKHNPNSKRHPPKNPKKRFYYYSGDLRRSMKNSVFFEKDWSPYVGLTLIIEGSSGTNKVSLYQKNNTIRYRINRIVQKNKPSAFYFEISPIISTKNWMDLLGHLSDSKASVKFFMGSESHQPNEESRPLLRPAMKHYVKKNVINAINGVL